MITPAALIVALAAYACKVEAATAQSFVPAAPAPTAQSGNYTGVSNGTLSVGSVVPGKSFDRFIQIWLENTDYATAASNEVLQALASQGVLMTSYHAVTHPSEPNYIAVAGGDFFGLGDDSLYHIPSNISTIVDLLDQKSISWAEYQENMPTDNFAGYNYSSHNYVNSSATSNYTYYVRKHDPLEIYDSVATVANRSSRIRNFNDFADDLVNGTLPQWIFVTPNMVDDGHDTDINFVGDWLQAWLIPLLKDTRFNDNRTLVLLTFDENETYEDENVVFSILLGGAVADDLKNTTDSTFYTHYSSLSTVQANWGLGSLGRQDTNTTMSNVYDFVAKTVGYTNVNVTDKPMTNLTGNIPGPLNSAYYTPFLAPNTSAVGAGGGPVFVAPGLNTSLTTAGAPVNLTAQGKTSPWENSTSSGSATSPSGTAPAPSGSGSSSGAISVSFGPAAVAMTFFAALFAGLAL